ncbi:MAG: pyrroline-5-carboxylate reductase [Lentilitoribacter sp.]
MSSDRPIILLGAGNMGGAVLRGWLDNDLNVAPIYVADPGLKTDMVKLLDERGVGYGPSVPSDTKASVLVLAIKPQMMDKILPSVISCVDENTLIVSIAAGTTIAVIKSHIAQGLVVRAMPNTPAMIGRGITGVVAQEGVSGEGRELVTQLLSVCGPVEWFDDESTIDAVTAVSGSGPAYVFLLAEVMAQAGIKAGLEPELAMRLARETVSGAGELMRRADEDASTLRRNVTSPGGTTAAALAVLMAEEDGMQQIFDRAIMAAKKRSEELAK